MSTTLKTIMDNVAREVKVAPPSVWVSSTLPTVLELKALLFQAADELLERIDWNDCTLDQVLTGTGVSSYALASDFKRLTRDETAVLELSPSRRAATPITTNGAWTNIVALRGAGAGRYFRIRGDSAEFFPALPTGASVSLSYLTTKWIEGGSGRAATWVADTDTVHLPDRLLEMGTIWRWRRGKGLAYADRQNEYEIELSRRGNDSRTIRRLDMIGPGPHGPRLAGPILPDFLPPV